jgi:hypothetical protein
MKLALWTAALSAVLSLSGCGTSPARKDMPSTNGRLPELRGRAEDGRTSIAFLDQRLASNRWQVRYGLQGELNGRDSRTKGLLEILARDSNPRVANQALRRYMLQFTEVDRSVFDPQVFVGGKSPVPTILKRDHARAVLLAYCLGQVKIEEPSGFRCSIGGDLPTLVAADSADANVADTIAVVGMLGGPKDAAALHPFAASENDYVALTAAQALFRLGDEDKSRETLERLIAREVTKHLHYITEALHVLKEIDRRAFEASVPPVLARARSKEGIQPNWLNGFLLLAAEVQADALE